MLFTLDPTTNQLVKTKEVAKDYIRTSYQRIYHTNKEDPRVFLLRQANIKYGNGLFDLIEENRYSRFINKDKAIAHLFEVYKQSIEDYLKETYTEKQSIIEIGSHPIGSVMILKQVVNGEMTEYMSYSLLHPKDRWDTRTAIKSTVGKLVAQLNIPVDVKNQYKETIIGSYLTY
jgi:hypothetical protein